MKKNWIWLISFIIDTRYPGGIGLLPSGFPTDQDAMGIFETAETDGLENSDALAGGPMEIQDKLRNEWN